MGQAQAQALVRAARGSRLAAAARRRTAAAPLAAGLVAGLLVAELLAVDPLAADLLAAGPLVAPLRAACHRRRRRAAPRPGPCPVAPRAARPGSHADSQASRPPRPRRSAGPSQASSQVAEACRCRTWSRGSTP